MVPLPAAIKVFETTQQNDSELFAQPLNLGTAAAGKTPSIDVSGTVAAGQIFPGFPPSPFDVDYYKFDLKAGDILSGAVFGAGQSLDLLFPNGRLLAASDQAIPLNFPDVFGPIFPADSPLQTQGNAVLANVIPADGTYFLRVAPLLENGNYTIQLRVHRPFLESEPVGTKQILYLDFDGGIFPANEIIRFQPGTVRVDPIGTVLDQLNPGLPSDEDRLIDQIVELVKADFASLAETGSNGDFDSTGIPGEFAIDIRNSRDDGEMWGLPNVSRIIVGGTLADVFEPDDSGLLGQAATIDVGNFDTTESAFVLADPQAIFAQLVPTGPSTTQLDVLARSFATTISHEAGHILGAFHQDPSNSTTSIMDPFLGPRTLGTGPDGILGTEDDEVIRFADEEYRPFEIYTRGFEHVTETLAFGMSTGTIGGLITGTVFDDSNADGDRDAGEPPFVGVRVFADLNSNGTRDTGEPFALSQADGTFSMTAVPGTYPVRVELPADTIATTPESRTVTVARGGSAPNLLFGISRLVTTSTGFKWQDTNGNGTREPNEPGIPDVYVYIDLDNDNELDVTEPQAKTAADGSYTLQFPSRPGTYAVREVFGAGFIPTFPAGGEHTVVHDGVTAPINLNFGNRPARDFGDAPAPFPTQGAGAASHGFLVGLHLGDNIDFEPDGQRAPDGSATGDDINGAPLPGGGVVDDEDGIVLSKPLNPDNPVDNQIRVTATNTTGRPARLQGWIDFNNDGDWLDNGEQIVRDRIVAGGAPQFIDFVVPTTAVRGELLNARFRYGFETGIGPAGAAGAGEVEDYQFQIQPQAGLAVDDNFQVPRNSVANRLDVVANDFDSLLDPIVAVIPRAGQAAGTVQVDADNRTLLYTPRSGFIGRDTFTYEIVTESGVTETATVTVDVSFQSAVPVAVDDIFEISETSSDVPLDVLRNDVRSVSGNLAIVNVFVDSGSSVQIAPGGTALRYTPAPGLTGTDQFTYTISDSSGQVSTATVTVNLLPSARADDDVRFDVQAVNDAGQPISVIRAGQQFNLVVTATDLRSNVGVNSRGVGSAYMDILYTDGLLSTVPNTATGSPFDFQVTFDDTFNVARTGDATIPGLINEIGAAQDSTSEFQSQLQVFTLRMLARSPGMAEFKTDPADAAFSDVVLLDPANPELTASDIQFGSTSLRIVPANGDFAFAVDDIFPNPNFPTAIPQNAQLVALDVLANDNAGPSGEIQIVTVDQPANGFVSINRRGNSDPSDDVIQYTPDQNFVGTDQFRYRIVSLEGVTSEAVVTVQVGTPAADVRKLGIDFEVRQDPADTDATINVGDNFLLDVFVDDLRTDPVGGAGQDLRGIFAAFFDLIYESDQVQLVNVPQNTNSTDPRSVLGFEVEFGPNYGNQVFSGDDSFPGIIDEFGAVQNGNEPLGPDRQLFATLTLRAVRSGNAVFIADPAEARPFSDSLLFEPPDRLEIGEIRYGSVVVPIANGEGEFTNSTNPLDVNNDGFVSPIDALNVINVLNRQGPGDLSSLSGEGESSGSAGKRLFIDTNGDKRLSPIDALVVINHLNSVSRGVAEGEAAGILAAPAAEQAASRDSESSADAVFEDLATNDLATGGFDNDAAAAALVPSPDAGSANSDDEDDPLVDLLADDLSDFWS